MYCKKCGSQINDNAAFCKKCGAPIHAKSKHAETPNDIPTAETKLNIKKRWIWGLSFGVLLAFIGAFLALRNVGIHESGLSESEYRSSIESHMRDVHGVTEVYSINVHDTPDYGPSASFNVHRPVDGLYLEMPNTIQLDKKGNVVSCEWCTLGINGEQDDLTSADITNNLADADTTAINLDDYVGKWHIDGQFYDSEYDCYETNLFIKKLGDNCVNFSIFYFRVGSIESEVTFNGNEADFICDDEYYTVGGTLTLNENSITVDITSSDHPYIPVETMTFDVRHNKICDGEGSASTPISGLPTCPRCGEPLLPETECGCTWCDICNAWMLGHGHEEGDPLVDP